VIREICAAAGSPLTAEEWRNAVADRAYRDPCEGRDVD
jgi:hypothetical protein